MGPIANNPGILSRALLGTGQAQGSQGQPAVSGAGAKGGLLASIRAIGKPPSDRGLGKTPLMHQPGGACHPVRLSKLGNKVSGLVSRLNNAQMQQNKNGRLQVSSMRRGFLSSTYKVKAEDYCSTPGPKSSEQMAYFKGGITFKPMSQEIKQLTVKVFDRNKDNKDYFASDMILAQLGKAANVRAGGEGKDITADDLPAKFPPKLSFEKVVNKPTIGVLITALEARGVRFEADTPDWSLTITQDSDPELFQTLIDSTPIGKTARNAINDFNALKGTKSEIHAIKLRHSESETNQQESMTRMNFYVK